LDLREKFLSVFDVASVLDSQRLPTFCLQLDITPPVLDASRAKCGPIPSNDFPHVVLDPKSWSACLQLEAEKDERHQQTRALSVPLANCYQQGPPSPELLKRINAAAQRIRALWPGDQIGASWPDLPLSHVLSDPNSPLYHMFHWVGSNRLNGESLLARVLSKGYGKGSDKERFIDGQLGRMVRSIPPVDLLTCRTPC
jgi:hypothetical protein